MHGIMNVFSTIMEKIILIEIWNLIYKLNKKIVNTIFRLK